MRNAGVISVLLLGLSGVVPVSAGSAGAQKSQYTLFNPTPAAQMRELSTDRPDVTESPYTVDAGHFQVESSLIEYAYDDSGNTTRNEFSLMPSNLKIGLLNNADLQLVLEPHLWQSERADGHTDRADGFGNTEIRLKVNLWGNDGGPTALAVMPFVEFPTAPDSVGGTDHFAGGLIVPLTVELPREFSLTMMAEVDMARDDANDGYGTALVHTASLSHPLVKEVDGFLEYVGVASRELGETYLAQIDAGLTYGVNENTQLDASVQFGLTDAVDDVRFLLGLSIRI
jgi:hypothetical protein